MYESKLEALVHYVCARCDNPNRLGATKLNKVLWYSDVFAFAQDGESITGATYVKRQFGPVPKSILEARGRLKASGVIVERDAINHGLKQVQFISIAQPDVSMFSASQISLVDTVLDAICRKHTASSISALSHNVIWEVAEIGEEIPMAAAAFAGNIGELDENDMAWAQKEVARIEESRVSA